MPAKDESKESAKYLLYVKLLHDGALSAEDKGAYENMQTVYGYSASETPRVPLPPGKMPRILKKISPPHGLPG